MKLPSPTLQNLQLHAELAVSKFIAASEIFSPLHHVINIRSLLLSQLPNLKSFLSTKITPVSAQRTNPSLPSRPSRLSLLTLFSSYYPVTLLAYLRPEGPGLETRSWRQKEKRGEERAALSHRPAPEIQLQTSDYLPPFVIHLNALRFDASPFSFLLLQNNTDDILDIITSNSVVNLEYNPVQSPANIQRRTIYLSILAPSIAGKQSRAVQSASFGGALALA